MGRRTRAWQNQAHPFDVNEDGSVTSADMQAINDYISAHGAGTLPEPPVSPNVPPPYVDVNGDGAVNTTDTLNVLNYLTTPPTLGQVLITSYEYDNNSSSGGGDGNLTKETQHVDSNSSNDRVTTYGYDWRNRRTSIDGELELYITNEYDNLDRVTVVKRWNTSSSSSSN